MDAMADKFTESAVGYGNRGAVEAEKVPVKTIWG